MKMPTILLVSITTVPNNQLMDVKNRRSHGAIYLTVPSIADVHRILTAFVITEIITDGAVCDGTLPDLMAQVQRHAHPPPVRVVATDTVTAVRTAAQYIDLHASNYGMRNAPR